MAGVVDAQLYAQETLESVERKPERAEASLYANPRLLDEETTAVVATAAEELVLEVDGFGVVETLVESVVGVTIGAMELETATGTIEVETTTGVAELLV